MVTIMTRGKIFLTREGSKLAEKGELNIYSQWISRIEGRPPKGSIVKIYNSNGELIGQGFYENLGAIGVRILTKKDEELNLQYIINKIIKANNLRKERLKLKSFYRVVNADGDDLPGLIIDRYEEILVIQSSSIGFDKILTPLSKLLIKELDVKTIYIKNDQRSRREVGLEIWRKVIEGEKKTRTIIVEGEVKFHVDVEKGQKTGFFIDQRPNRIELEEYIERDDEVLDLYGYTGGFTLHAAIKGATATLIDESEYAVKEAKNNAKLNRVEDKVKIIRERVENYLEKCNKNFDIIIVDPPALIPSKNKIKAGKKAYLNLYKKVLSKLKKNGLLVASSCSFFLNEEEFIEILVKAASKIQRELKITGKVRGASPCHITRPRDKHLRYLKVIFAIVS